MSSALFLRPSYETLTQYVSLYLEGAVDNARRLGFHVFDLYADEATQENFFRILEEFNPYVVAAGSHGLENILFCQGGERLLTACVNDDVLSEKVCFALACRTAISLGPSSVSKHCQLYFGWLSDYIVILDESYEPLSDPYAWSFLRPVLVGLDVLFNDVLAGVDVQTLAKNVYEAVVNAFNEEIKYWREVPTATASQMLTYLIHDRDNFVPITATGVYTPELVEVEIPWKPIFAVGMLALPLLMKA